MNSPRSLLNSLASLSGVLGMNERPLDSSAICYLVNGLSVRLMSFSLAQEKQSGMTHFCALCVFLDLFFLDFLFLLTDPVCS